MTMPEPKRCSFSAVLNLDHVPHLWRRPALPVSDAAWVHVDPTDADEPGVYSCDGVSTKAPAVADV